MKKKTKLIPPDLKQCQCEIQQGSFMTLGPRYFERCANAAEYVISYKTKPGSMSVCTRCLAEAKKQGLDINIERIATKVTKVVR